MDQQRAAQGPDGTYDLQESHGFAYKALSKELYVGQVYLRVYNDQPEFDISEPEAFCVALVEFLSSLVHNEYSKDTYVPSNGNQSEPVPETHEFQGDKIDGLGDGQHVPLESAVVSEGHVAEKEEFPLIKNLRFGLISLQVVSFSHTLVINPKQVAYIVSLTDLSFFPLQNLLTSNPNLASILSSKEKLVPIFECFSVPEVSESNIPQLCLSVLSLLTAYAPCLEAMVADVSSILLLFQMLHASPKCREGALHVLYALASTPELAWAAAKHGGVVYILELLLPRQGRCPYHIISLDFFVKTL